MEINSFIKLLIYKDLKTFRVLTKKTECKMKDGVPQLQNFPIKACIKSF